MAHQGIKESTTKPAFESHLRQRRQASGFSQRQLASMSGITRQAVAAVEANQYSPATSVALQLARALHCRVEDLFTIKNGDQVIMGELLGSLARSHKGLRALVTNVGGRTFVRPLEGAGELTSLTSSADGLIVGFDPKSRRAKVRLLKDRDMVQRQLVVGGCDPAMFLAARHLNGYDKNSLVPCLMGNGLALAALKRGELHAAGIHIADEEAPAKKLPDVKRALRGLDCAVVTFAHWEEGLIVRPGNPRQIRAVADVARPTVRIVNREKGSGARRLLDRELQSAGVPATRVKGYADEVLSHLEVAAHVRAGLVDAGVGARAAAAISGLDFIPLQRERYDLVIPRAHYDALPSLRTLLDLIVNKSFREEIEAFGGYDTRDTGKIVAE
jgi:molybdate-binding protein/DNA-binding XRE family transcriptional regulator